MVAWYCSTARLLDGPDAAARERYDRLGAAGVAAAAEQQLFGMGHRFSGRDGFGVATRPGDGPRNIEQFFMGNASDDRDDNTAVFETALYDALGIATDASAAIIKAAYRKLALQYHPDRHAAPDAAAAAERFVELGRAYEILSDAGSRARYDRGGMAAVDEPPRAVPDGFLMGHPSSGRRGFGAARAPEPKPAAAQCPQQ
jgi:DnaJ-class molecular chaperone